MNIEPCNKNCGHGYKVILSKLNNLHVVYINDPCYCLLRESLNQFPIKSGTICISLSRGGYIYKDYHYEIQEGSTLAFIKTDNAPGLSTIPVELRCIININGNDMDFHYTNKDRMTNAEISTEDLETANLLVKMLSKKKTESDNNDRDFYPVLDGSPMVIQFPKDVKSSALHKYIHDLETAISQTDINTIETLQKENTAINVGEQDFFEEIIKEVNDAKVKGNKKLQIINGYCNGCISGSPVKIIAGIGTNFGLHYYFEADDPVEIHACTYCSISKKEYTIDDFMDSSIRRKEYVEMTMRLGRAMISINMDEMHSICKDLVAYNYDGTEITEAPLYHFINLINTFKDNPITEMKLVFKGCNEDDWMTNPDDYNGLPCLLYKKDGVETLLMWSGTEKAIDTIIEIPNPEYLYDFTITPIKISVTR